MRIVSLVPSATEILFALGLDDEVVGVSHECDFPAAARNRRIVIRSRMPVDAHPAEVDRLVCEYVARGESLYSVDAEALQDLAPDLILTQELCHVCAASPDDLATALARCTDRPELLSLNPQDLGDVWRDILWIGEETGRRHVAEQLLESIGERLELVEKVVRESTERPRVAFLEWLQPFYISGHWVPEMIELAGGIDLFGRVGTPSTRVSREAIMDAAPDVLLISPCGYSAERARTEYQAMQAEEDWNTIPAVRQGLVYALDANSYFSRSGPRLITGLEALATIFHGRHISAEATAAALPIHNESKAVRAASR